MKPMSTAVGLEIGATILDVVALVTVAIISALHFCFVRRYNDAARGWLRWTRWSLSVFQM